MRAAHVGSVAITAALVTAALAVARRPSVLEGRAVAERLSRAALDSQFALNYSAAYSLTQQSLRADPSYLPSLAHLYQQFMSDEAPTTTIEFLDSLADHVSDRVL